MKKLSIRLLVTFLVLSCSTGYIRAQNEIDYDAEGGLVQFNIFHFEGSEKYDIIFPLSGQTEILSLEIKSYISSGILSIKIFDPTGEEQGNFSVQGQVSQKITIKKNEIRRSVELSTTKMRIEKNPWIFTEENFKIMGMGDKVAQASISRSFRNPLKSNWTIKILCTNAKGFFTIESNQKLFNSILPSKVITGMVTDTKNRPLRGATVLIKGTSMATVSDNNGNFTVPLPENADTLVFHYKGMISREVAIGDQIKLSVILEQKK